MYNINLDLISLVFGAIIVSPVALECKYLFTHESLIFDFFKGM